MKKPPLCHVQNSRVADSGVGGKLRVPWTIRVAPNGSNDQIDNPQRSVYNLVKVQLISYTMKTFLFLITAAILISLPGVAPAETLNPWTTSVYFENDLFNGTDSHYTNGVKASMISPDLTDVSFSSRLGSGLLKMVHRIPVLGETSWEDTHKIELSIGQNMYTPADISRSDLIEDDRPYAGWTYWSTAYHQRYETRGQTPFMDTVEVQIGMVGPASLAEETQKFVHKVRDIDRPNGWDNQLKNEPGIVLAFERKWLLWQPPEKSAGCGVITHAGAALGNISTYFNFGFEFRAGWNLPGDFGISLIRPAGSTRLAIEHPLSVYLFGAMNGRIVARDIFLDGNTFTDSHNVDRNPLVADLAAGIALRYKRFFLTFTEIHRTKEFDGQDRAHSFGSIAFSASFPLDLVRFLRISAQ